MLGLEIHLAGQNTSSALGSDLGPQYVLLNMVESVYVVLSMGRWLQWDSSP